jgi:hypothetical protein
VFLNSAAPDAGSVYGDLTKATKGFGCLVQKPMRPGGFLPGRIGFHSAATV